MGYPEAQDAAAAERLAAPRGERDPAAIRLPLEGGGPAGSLVLEHENVGLSNVNTHTWAPKAPARI